MPSGKQLAPPCAGVLGPGAATGSLPAQATEARFQGTQPLPVLPQGPTWLAPAQPPWLLLRGPKDQSDCSAFKGTEGWGGRAQRWGCRD